MTVALVIIAVLAIGTALGFFVSKNIMFKYLEENNPINEQMIRMMLMQSGQKASHKKINQILSAVEKARTKK